LKYIVYLVSSELTVQLAVVLRLCNLTTQKPLWAQLQEIPKALQKSFRTSLVLNINLSCWSPPVKCQSPRAALQTLTEQTLALVHQNWPLAKPCFTRYWSIYISNYC